MQGTKVATRYAKSIFDLALEKGAVQEVFNDMKLIHSQCRSSKDLELVLKSPIIKSDKKEKIAEAIWSNVHTITKSFISIIIRKKREMYLEAISEAYVDRYMKHNNILKAIITTASGLDEELKAKVIAIVKESTKSEVELVEKKDPSIIGGFILRVGDKQDDTSIRTKINKLNRVFKENPYIKEY